MTMPNDCPDCRASAAGCPRHTLRVFPNGTEHRPWQCPVCGGKRKVPNGFYEHIGVSVWQTMSTEPDPCRVCNGTGIV